MSCTPHNNNVVVGIRWKRKMNKRKMNKKKKERKKRGKGEEVGMCRCVSIIEYLYFYYRSCLNYLEKKHGHFYNHLKYRQCASLTNLNVDIDDNVEA